MNAMPDKLIRLMIVLISFLILPASAALNASTEMARQPAPQALVRVDLDNPSELEQLVDSRLVVYAHLFSPSGQEYLLLPADAGLQARLVSQGLALQILDADASSASYYLLHTRSPKSLQRAGGSPQILEQDGRVALAKAEPAQAERLASLGIEINHLVAHPLVSDRRRLGVFPQAIEPDPAIQGMIDQVSSDTVYDYDGSLSGEWSVVVGGETYTIATRNSRTTTEIEKATQYTFEHFEALGLDTSYHYYDLSGSGMRRNVIAEQAGSSQPERIFLVTAHLDSTVGIPFVSEPVAPGADDNASGSVGVLIAADILSQYDFGCTLRYALFTGEEQGLIGSYYYAQDAYNNGDNIEGVLNLDMISFNSDASPVVELHTRPGNPDDLAIAGLFSEVVSTYSLDLEPHVIQDGESRSDHFSFWQFGYPAILGIENYGGDFNPYYHTANDRLGNLNLAYFTSYVKAAVGTLAHMGCFNSGLLEGQVSDVDSGSPLQSASVEAENGLGWRWSALSGADSSYQLALTAGTYTVTARAFGYDPYSTGMVEITANLTTTLDIQLQPHPIFTTFLPVLPAAHP